MIRNGFRRQAATVPTDLTCLQEPPHIHHAGKVYDRFHGQKPITNHRDFAFLTLPS